MFLISEKVFAFELLYFKYINLSLFIFNLMPYFPLDGGNIIKEILYFKKGIINAHKLTRKINSLFLGFMCIIFFIFLNFKIFNPSFIVFIIFLVLEKNKTKESFMCEKTMVLNGLFTYKKKIKVFIFDVNAPLLDIVSFISPYYYMVCLFFDGDKLKFVLSEREIVKKIKHKAKKVV